MTRRSDITSHTHTSHIKVTGPLKDFHYLDIQSNPIHPITTPSPHTDSQLSSHQQTPSFLILPLQCEPRRRLQRLSPNPNPLSSPIPNPPLSSLPTAFVGRDTPLKKTPHMQPSFAQSSVPLLVIRYITSV